jgi:ACR3 family arsenite efflux pump ArsB
MPKMKKVFCYIGNILIGIISCYSYLYFWMLFSWGEPFKFFSLETLISICISIIIFLGYNYLLLRKESSSKKYWWISLGLVLLSIIVFISIIEYS